MARPDPARVKQIVAAALDRSPAEREAFVAGACGDDAELLAEVQSLLAAMGAASQDRFLADVSTRLSSQPLTEAAGACIGPYKLLQKIGEGGFGAVFLAEQEKPVRRRVALKVIKLGMDTRQVVARFEQEREALAMMDHPNIAKVFDAGATESGRPFFVMEYVKGDPLTKFADAHKLSVGDRLRLFVQVCEAVQHAHTKGVIHRDLKPGNILVSMVDGRPHAKVIDFGIAKATGARLTNMTLFTEHEQLIGTPEYMSPEQAEGSPDIDTRTDVYALGVLLYELLTGVTPFDARRLRSAGFEAMRQIIRQEEPPAPSLRLTRNLKTLGEIATARRVEASRLSVLLRGELDWIVLKSLEKDRARRYGTPSDLAADVQRHLSGEPVVAAPPSVGYRVWKFVRKHRGVVATTGLVVLALTLGGSLAAWQWKRAEGALVEKDVALVKENAAREDSEWKTYSLGLALAQNEMRANNWYEARRRLAECPTECQGIEYRLLLQEARRYIVADEQSLVVSADRTRVLTWSIYRIARLWDAASGAAIGEPMKHDADIRGVIFSPDETRVLTRSEDQTARLWDAASGAAIGEPMKHDADVRDAIFSPDGTRVLTWSDDRTARLWDAGSGAAIGEPMKHQADISDAIFSPDGTRVLTRSDDRTARLWNAGSGAAIGEPMKHQADIFDAIFSPDGTRVLTRSKDQAARLWDAASGAAIGQPMKHDRDWLPTFSPDGTRVLTWTKDHTARLWDAASGAAIGEPMKHDDDDRLPIFSPDGTRVLTWSNDRTARLWDAGSGAAIGQPMKHGDYIRCAIFSRDGTRVLTWSYDRTARLWDAGSGAAIGEPMKHDADVRDAIFSPDGTRLLTTDSRAVIHRWDAANGQRIGAPTQCSSDPRVVDLPAADRSRRILSTLGYASMVEDADELPPARTTLATDDREGALQLTMIRPVTPPGSAPHSTVTPDGSRVVTILNRNTLRFSNRSDGREITTIPLDASASGVTFSEDGTRLVVCFSNKSVEVWDSRDAAARRADEEALWNEREAVRPWVDELLATPKSVDERERLVCDDAQLPPLRRLAALRELRLDFFQEDLAAKRAFERLDADYVSVTKLRARAEAEQLPPRVKAAFLKRIDEVASSSEKLAGRAWAMVKQASRPMSAYDDAVEDARVAVALSPQDSFALNTLGAALVRATRFEEALETLTHARVQIRKKSSGDDWPSNVAFLAMTLARLERAAEAREELRRLRKQQSEAADSPQPWGGNSDELAWLREASELIDGVAPPSSSEQSPTSAPVSGGASP